jgi:hypothetical protein
VSERVTSVPGPVTGRHATSGRPTPWRDGGPELREVRERRLERAGRRYGRPNTTIVGEPRYWSTQKLEGLPEAAAMYCLPSTA